MLFPPHVQRFTAPDPSLQSTIPVFDISDCSQYPGNPGFRCKRCHRRKCYCVGTTGGCCGIVCDDCWVALHRDKKGKTVRCTRKNNLKYAESPTFNPPECLETRD